MEPNVPLSPPVPPDAAEPEDVQHLRADLHQLLDVIPDALLLPLRDLLLLYEPPWLPILALVGTLGFLGLDWLGL